MIAVARPGEGRVAVVAPHGVLFRGGAEGRIRESLVRDNLLDAVVGLPAQLFPTTGIPVCIMIFDRAREAGGLREHEKDVLFIDASRGFTPGKKQNQLDEGHLSAILNTYRSRAEVPKYSHKALFSELEANGFNLNIPRYVDTFEPEAEIDLASVQKEIQDIEQELAATRRVIDTCLAELGVRV
jgi:type I restriction enzyme M protein